MKKVKKNTVLVALFVLIVFMIGVELLLRESFGFADAVLFREDQSYEYIALPQNRNRFGQKVLYNSQSQRNREISPSDAIIVLGFGDSVLNGGVLVDQDSLATTKLSVYFSEKHNTDFLFSNIGAPSWGPDNCFAYLKKHGHFGADKFLLVVSSHDAYDHMDFEKVVGIHESYPNEQYSLAIGELFGRYVYPRYLQQYVVESMDIRKEEKENSKANFLRINKQNEDSNFNRGFESFKNYSDSLNIPLTIYLHAEKDELEKGEYNKHGQQIIEFCRSNNIPLIQELEYSFPDDAYLDHIHLSERGHHYLFQILKTYFQDLDTLLDLN